MSDNNIIVEFPSGHRAALAPDTPVYVESWAACHGARADDGSMCSVDDMEPAGTLGSPDSMAGGRFLHHEVPFTYYVADGNGMAEPIEIVVEGDAL